MVWKIVKTIGEGRSFITAVPYTWEDNELVYWPPPGLESIDKVRANLTLAPGWSVYKCEVKIQRIDVSLEAKKLEKLLFNVGTEIEEDVMFNYELKKRKRNEPKIRLVQLDFNESLPQASSSLVPSNSSTSTGCSGGSCIVFGSNMCSQQSPQAISFKSQTSSNSIDRIDTLLSNNSRERAHVPFTELPNTTNGSLIVIFSNQCPEETSLICRSPSNSMMNYTDMFLSSGGPERTTEDLAPYLPQFLNKLM
ncbi:uncharacterized protein LOC129801717 [Phlebotomus papatasi]|uniref:uncharacterized protein LOC129801717 n=1 Tax=Phlebotomus papatasi TaxID=29031 RepID=UPI0024840F8E|nr:uncharacterized protein LOC129801717 [Phlebotomus papatasi]